MLDRIASVVSAMVIALVFSNCQVSAAALQTTRVIERSPVTPIEKRLRPDDEVVIVRDFPLVTGLEDEAVSVPREIEWLVATSDAAVVVEVVDLTGRLVNGGLWVHSTIGVRVKTTAMERQAGGRAVLTQSDLDGRRIELQWTHGGEVTIGKVQVRARPTQLNVGGTYLLFIDRVGSEWHLGSRFAIQKDGMLTHLLEPDDSRKHARSPLDGLLLENVLREIRQEAARFD